MVERNLIKKVRGGKGGRSYVGFGAEKTKFIGIEMTLETDYTGTENTNTGIQTEKTGTEIDQMSFLNTLSETERKILDFIMEDPGIT